LGFWIGIHQGRLVVDASRGEFPWLKKSAEACDSFHHSLKAAAK
jgi:hypothetical protein